MGTLSIAERVAAGVLGQSRGNYYAAPITVEQCVAMGFDTAAGAAGDPTRMANDVEYVTQVLQAAAVEFDALAVEWVRVVEERRAQTAGETP